MSSVAIFYCQHWKWATFAFLDALFMEGDHGQPALQAGGKGQQTFLMGSREAVLSTKN